jgi:hypothetical protein
MASCDELAGLGCACAGCCSAAAPLAEELSLMMHAQHAWVGAVVPLLGRSALLEQILVGIFTGVVVEALKWLCERCCRCGSREDTRGAMPRRDDEETQGRPLWAGGAQRGRRRPR